MTTDRVAQPLSQHLVLRSHDATEIEARLSSTYNESKIHVTPTDRDKALSHELYFVPLGRIMLTSMTFQGGFEVVAPELEETYDFCSAHRDCAEVRIGGDACDFGPTAGVVLSPHRPFHVRSRGYCSLNVAVPRPVMESQLQALTGQELSEPLEFDAAIDFRDGKLESLWRLVRFLAAEIEYSDSALFNPLLCERYSETLITGFLLHQPHNYSRLIHDKVSAAEPQYVRKVEEYLLANCDRAITTSELAAIAGLSISALYAGFKKVRGCTPLGFLKDARLRRVRDDLLTATPGMTVKEIASRWGFNHLGRFSREYASRFGELPSETLCKSLK